MVTTGEYIDHHLHHLGFSAGAHPFWTFNLDTMIISVILGFMALGFMALVARTATVEAPSKWQNAIEMIVEFIENTVKETYHGKIHFVAPLAMTIFIWVFFMNFMDLIPVDLLPQVLKLFGVEHFKAVPTADPSLTFALSLSVFVLIIFFNLRYKGLFGLLKEMFCAPFGPWLFPINFIFRLIEEVVKPLSLSLRLFGNMFASEIVFILIAITPWYAHVTLGLMWSILHILVITIQAFVFMMLTVVYLNMAKSAH